MAKRKPRGPYWVIAHSGTLMLECERCGRKCKPDLPMEFDVYIAMGKAFTKVHSKCKARETEAAHG